MFYRFSHTPEAPTASYFGSSSRVLRTLALAALLALPGCKSGRSGATVPPPPHTARAEFSNEFMATAKVVAVEREQRLVTLQREDGSLFVLHVGQAARNFDQLAAGDTVRVGYRESLAASLQPAGASAQAAQGVIGAGRTESGAKPGGGLGVAMSVRVKIESIDLERGIVVFSLASGELVAHRIATAEGRAFVRNLNVGDVVQLDYAEALALSVEEL